MIRTKAEGTKYVIQDLDRDYIYKINKNVTDRELQKLKRILSALQKQLKDLYDNHLDQYLLIRDEVFTNLELDDGECWKINCILNNLQDLQEQLTHDDEIIPMEYIQTLEDFGYRRDHIGKWKRWEKRLEEEPLKEVVEEIQIADGEPLRRKRTILFEKTEYGKKSTSIKYRKLPIGKKLMQVINNTISKESGL